MFTCSAVRTTGPEDQVLVCRAADLLLHENEVSEQLVEVAEEAFKLVQGSVQRLARHAVGVAEEVPGGLEVVERRVPSYGTARISRK
jgi:hypothetical protein